MDPAGFLRPNRSGVFRKEWCEVFRLAVEDLRELCVPVSGKNLSTCSNRTISTAKTNHLRALSKEFNPRDRRDQRAGVARREFRKIALERLRELWPPRKNSRRSARCFGWIRNEIPFERRTRRLRAARAAPDLAGTRYRLLDALRAAAGSCVGRGRRQSPASGGAESLDIRDGRRSRNRLSGSARAGRSRASRHVPFTMWEHSRMRVFYTMNFGRKTPRQVYRVGRVRPDRLRLFLRFGDPLPSRMRATCCTAI